MAQIRIFVFIFLFLFSIGFVFSEENSIEENSKNPDRLNSDCFDCFVPAGDPGIGHPGFPLELKTFSEQKSALDTFGVSIGEDLTMTSGKDTISKANVSITGKDFFKVNLPEGSISFKGEDLKKHCESLGIRGSCATLSEKGLVFSDGSVVKGDINFTSIGKVTVSGENALVNLKDIKLDKSGFLKINIFGEGAKIIDNLNNEYEDESKQFSISRMGDGGIILSSENVPVKIKSDGKDFGMLRTGSLTSLSKGIRQTDDGTYLTLYDEEFTWMGYAGKSTIFTDASVTGLDIYTGKNGVGIWKGKDLSEGIKVVAYKDQEIDFVGVNPEMTFLADVSNGGTVFEKRGNTIIMHSPLSGTSVLSSDATSRSEGLFNDIKFLEDNLNFKGKTGTITSTNAYVSLKDGKNFEYFVSENGEINGKLISLTNSYSSSDSFDKILESKVSETYKDTKESSLNSWVFSGRGRNPDSSYAVFSGRDDALNTLSSAGINADSVSLYDNGRIKSVKKKWGALAAEPEITGDLTKLGVPEEIRNVATIHYFKSGKIASIMGIPAGFGSVNNGLAGDLTKLGVPEGIGNVISIDFYENENNEVENIREVWTAKSPLTLTSDMRTELGIKEEDNVFAIGFDIHGKPEYYSLQNPIKRIYVK